MERVMGIEPRTVSLGTRRKQATRAAFTDVIGWAKWPALGASQIDLANLREHSCRLREDR
jgi:hypothetical protein